MQHQNDSIVHLIGQKFGHTQQQLKREEGGLFLFRQINCKSEIPSLSGRCGEDTNIMIIAPDLTGTTSAQKQKVGEYVSSLLLNLRAFGFDTVISKVFIQVLKLKVSRVERLPLLFVLWLIAHPEPPRSKSGFWALTQSEPFAFHVAFLMMCVEFPIGLPFRRFSLYYLY